MSTENRPEPEPVLEPRPEALAAAPGVHGTPDADELRRLGLDPAAVLDFSTNINPHGPPPAVRAALARVPIDAYPDRDAVALREALGAMLDVPPGCIVAGNGVVELIGLVTLAFVRPGDRVVVVGPTFGEYARAAALMGAEVVPWTARADDDFAIDLAAVDELIGRHRPRVAFVCNPNNPTGVLLPPEPIAAWAGRHPSTLFVVDEAYLAFAPGARSCVAPEVANLLVLRSLTKDCALAGLRLGYAVGAPGLVEVLNRIRPPWSVNAMAQVAGVAALGERATIAVNLEQLAATAAELRQRLGELGLDVRPSAVSFFLARVGDAAEFRRGLLHRGLLVRDCASFGLPEFVRIAPRLPAENERLIKGWRVEGGGWRVEEKSVAPEALTPHPPPSTLHSSLKPSTLHPPPSTLMVMGTSSSAGKSLLVTALCRIFAKRGVRVAPFKAQNMSNNAAVCDDGSEIGRAQALQAAAAGIAPTADMNPILLKPEPGSRSQVIVNGRPWRSLAAGDYYAHKAELEPIATAALDRLRGQFDLVILEGAGSPAELNLNRAGYDLANMAMARHAQAPVLLVGDIDRGGIFAQLLGTLTLLDDDDRARVRGLVVNKFRGNPDLFDDGVRILEERGGVPVLGVIPFLSDLVLPEEDSMGVPEDRPEDDDLPKLDVAVIRLPYLANFDDFDPLRQEPGVRLRFVDSVEALGTPDAVILPGTKGTIADLDWLRARGLLDAVRRLAARGAAVVGLCGGYQMLGRSVRDPFHVESLADEAEGLGLLAVETEFTPTKVTRPVEATIRGGAGWLADLEGQTVSGYEIHMGSTESYQPWLEIHLRSGEPVHLYDGAISGNGRVWGCYLHGIFANAAFRRAWLASLRPALPREPEVRLIPKVAPLADWSPPHLRARAMPRPVAPTVEPPPLAPSLDESLDRLADAVAAALDLERLFGLVGIPLPDRGGRP